MVWYPSLDDHVTWINALGATTDGCGYGWAPSEILALPVGLAHRLVDAQHERIQAENAKRKRS